MLMQAGAMSTPAGRRSSTSSSDLSRHTWMLDKRKTEPHEAFFFIECVCNGWFTFELIIRFIVSPNKLAFVREPVNIIDLIATVSFYLDFILTYLKKENDVLEFFSIIRIMRLFKVWTTSDGSYIVNNLHGLQHCKR